MGINVRGVGLQNIQHYAITSNPIFKIKVRSLATNLEQKVNQDKKTNHTDLTKNFKKGDLVSGKILGEDETSIGKIIDIKANSDSVTILDKDTNKTVKLDITTINSYKEKLLSAKAGVTVITPRAQKIKSLRTNNRLSFSNNFLQFAS